MFFKTFLFCLKRYSETLRIFLVSLAENLVTFTEKILYPLQDGGAKKSPDQFFSKLLQT